jgi:SAM-dependent methyltransferase
MDYTKNFKNRINSFMYAVNKYEHCMENEFKAVIEELNLNDGEILVNLGGGGLKINKYITKNIKYMPFDFSFEWCEIDNSVNYTSHKNLPFVNDSVDKIVILAMLHHFSDEERIELYKECNRILKKTGKLIIADVKRNTNQDVWLNKCVDKYNPFGHKGLFFDFDDAKLLESQSFNVDVKNKKYTWWFNDKPEMLDYIKNLFYMDISDAELDYNLNIVLEPFIMNDKYHFNWELIYFICTPI